MTERHRAVIRKHLIGWLTERGFSCWLTANPAEQQFLKPQHPAPDFVAVEVASGKYLEVWIDDETGAGSLSKPPIRVFKIPDVETFQSLFLVGRLPDRKQGSFF